LCEDVSKEWIVSSLTCIETRSCLAHEDVSNIASCAPSLRVYVSGELETQKRNLSVVSELHRSPLTYTKITTFDDNCDNKITTTWFKLSHFLTYFVLCEKSNTWITTYYGMKLTDHHITHDLGVFHWDHFTHTSCTNRRNNNTT